MPDHVFAIPFHELKDRGMYSEAIIRQRIDYMAQEQKLNPFPSSPQFQPKCELRGDWPDEEKMQIRVFRGLWGAKLLYDFWVEGEDIHWISPTRLTLSNGLILTSPMLEQIAEYELTKKEASYVWPENFLNEVTAFKNKTVIKSANPQVKQSKLDKPVRERREPKEQKPRTPRPSKDGLITVGEIAAELGVHPRLARGVLRDKKLPKPDAGWAWPKAEAEKMKALIKKELKA